MSVAIEVTNVSKGFRVRHGQSKTLKEKILHAGTGTYEEFKALDNVSIDIEKGTTVGLMGANGSGKSTLLKIVSKILYPDTGMVKVYGRVSSLLELGAGFHPDFTGLENIRMNGAILGLSRGEIDSKIDEIIDFSGLRDFIYQPVKGYSSGMYMRLAFSVATAINPDILLIDEILAVGDIAFQTKCYGRLQELKDKGTTIVIVTHDLSAFEKYCDRVIWLESGKIVGDGVPWDVTKRYVSLTFSAPGEHNSSTQYELDKKQSSPAQEDRSSISEQRWGNGQVRITNVVIAGGDGKVHISGHPFTARIHYEFSSEYEGGDSLMFGMNITDLEGRSIFGTNTKIDGLDIKHVPRKGIVEFRCPHLQLLDGTYKFDASVYNINGTPFDHRLSCTRFSVVNPYPEAGVTRLIHEWQLPK